LTGSGELFQAFWGHFSGILYPDHGENTRDIVPYSRVKLVGVWRGFWRVSGGDFGSFSRIFKISRVGYAFLKTGSIARLWRFANFFAIFFVAVWRSGNLAIWSRRQLDFLYLNCRVSGLAGWVGAPPGLAGLETNPINADYNRLTGQTNPINADYNPVKVDRLIAGSMTGQPVKPPGFDRSNKPVDRVCQTSRV
jgi:hypothetical protein